MSSPYSSQFGTVLKQSVGTTDTGVPAVVEVVGVVDGNSTTTETNTYINPSYFFKFLDFDNEFVFG